jgi:general stress protein YciG
MAIVSRGHVKYIMRKAIKSGVLVRPKICELCGVQPTASLHGHHWHGYDEAHILDVQWLCIPCHNTSHTSKVGAALGGRALTHEQMVAVARSGGVARAANITPQERSELGRKGGCIRHHGLECGCWEQSD